MTRTLLIVDIQNDYFPGGAHPLVGATEAGAVAASVLAAFRRAGDPVVHVQHVWDAPDATFMRPGTPGVQINPAVTPAAGEPVVTKAEPNAFVGTDLDRRLDRSGTLVVMGMMTSMCIDSTVRAAADAGYTVELVHDACAAPDLEFGGTAVPGAAVHAAFVAALGDGFATLRSGPEVVTG
ncbi:cysteine hydrolase family protein [Nakamurella sp.]|uniref:cysteine hydrolase family protein n=1 Tax=Nakamurella sp. TaxID=1869182 RepID=UPI003B3AAA51